MPDDGYQWTEAALKEWKRVRRKVDELSGDGVSNAPDYITINRPRGPSAPRPSEDDPEALRVIVVEANVATGPVVQLVKALDQDGNQVSAAFPVVSLCKMATNDELYVFRPTGGLTGAPAYSGEKIVWRDCRLPGVYEVTLTASGGSTAANPANRTYNYKLQGYATTINASAQGPTWRPYAGAIATDAMLGQAYIDLNGVPTLRIAYEGLTRGSC